VKSKSVKIRKKHFSSYEICSIFVLVINSNITKMESCLFIVLVLFVYNFLKVISKRLCPENTGASCNKLFNLSFLKMGSVLGNLITINF